MADLRIGSSASVSGASGGTLAAAPHSHSHSHSHPHAANVSVHVRLRPAENKDYVIVRDNTRLSLTDPTSKNRDEREFNFDTVFDADATQQLVFDQVCKPMVETVLEGYNSCCFAYGQTSSGKTYSIFGEPGEKRGIVPRSMEYLFMSLEGRTRSKKVVLFVSFLEIYLEKVRDLGKFYLDNSRSSSASSRKSTSSRPSSSKRDDYENQNLEIRQDESGNVFVKDLTTIPVTSIDEVIDIVAAGMAKRQTHETLMNSFSSRSHTVFTLTVIQSDKAGDGPTITGMLNLVDLAGSERLTRSQSAGQRLQEAVMINSSLSALGKVVMALNTPGGSSSRHIPYRESQLTRLLQNSLGGNSYTTLLACINPDPSNYDESVSTLSFANKCLNVQNMVRVNYLQDPDEANELEKNYKIKQLQDEVTALKQLIAVSQQGKDALQHHLALIAAQTIKEQALAAAAKKGRTGVGPDATAGRVAIDGGGPGSAATSDNNSKRLSLKPATNININGSGTSNNNSNAHEDDSGSEEMKALHKTIAGLNKKYDLLKAAMDAKAVQHSRMQGKTKLNREKLMSDLVQYKERVNTLQQQLQEHKTMLEQERNKLHTDRTKEVTELVSHNQQLLDETNERMNKLRDALKKMEYQNEALSRHEEVLNEEFAVERKKWAAQRSQDLDNVRQQYEYWLGKKSDEIKKFVTEFNEFKTAKEAQLDDHRREIKYLYEYSDKLTQVIEHLESSSNSLVDNSAIKMFNLPDQQRSMIKLDVTQAKHVKRSLKQAEQFLTRAHRLATGQQRPATVPVYPLSGTMNGISSGLFSPQSSSSASLVPAGSAPISRSMSATEPSASSRGGTASVDGQLKEVSTLTLEELRAEVVLLRNVVGGSGDDVTSDLLASKLHTSTRNLSPSGSDTAPPTFMSSSSYSFGAGDQLITSNKGNDHRIVAYIEKLATERDLYRCRLQEQVKKQNDLRVAFEAQGRALARATGRFNSPSRGSSAGKRPLSASSKVGRTFS